MSISTSYLNGSGPSVASRNNLGGYSATPYQEEQPDSNPFVAAGDALEALLLASEDISNNRYKEIKENSRRARETQEMSNHIDEVIAQAAKGDNNTREKIPDDVIKYMRDNGITLDDMTIDQYIQKNGDKDGALDKGQLQAVKAALDNSANRDTDLMQQGQLTIEKMTQQITTVFTQLTDMINKWGSINTQIAQKMYS